MKPAFEELDLDETVEDAGAILGAGAMSLASERPGHQGAAETEPQKPRRS